MLGTEVKSLTSVIFLSPGFKKMRFNYLLYHLGCMHIPIEDIHQAYKNIPNEYSKLVIDCRTHELKYFIVNR